MLDLLLKMFPTAATETWLRLGNYITVRAAAALLFAFLLSIWIGPSVIAWLKKLKVGQYIRRISGEHAVELNETHFAKAGTPTMGGVLMAIGILGAALLFADWSQPVLWLALLAMVGFGSIGFADDYRKLTGRTNQGLTAREKIVAQLAVGTAFGLLLLFVFPDVITYSGRAGSVVDSIFLPFVKEAVISLGVLYLLFAIFILTATTNAVNLTDGLDGLASGVTVTAAICLGVVAYMAGRTDTSTYLFIPRVEGAGELAVLLAALVGACLGFLWYNCHPAQVFMGDTGSMLIGGLLGAVALLLKQEFLLAIAGGVFVAEALSVILQVGSMKLRQKRVFLMSPLHHHFEKMGVPESKIIARFWIVSALLALAGLSTLKLR